MATKPQRAKAILDALADPATTDAAMLQTVGDAFAFTYRRGETLTQAQQAGLFIQVVRDFVVQITRDAIKSRAAAAASAAADSNVDLGSNGV